MTCERIHEVHAWHDGEMSANRREEFTRHLAGCGVCQSELRQIEALSRVLRIWQPPKMAADAVGRIHSAVDRMGERSVLHIAEALAAAAAIILAIGLAFLMQGPPSSPGTVARPGLSGGGTQEIVLTDGMPDELIRGIQVSSGNAVELAQWIEPSLGLGNQP